MKSSPPEPLASRGLCRSLRNAGISALAGLALSMAVAAPRAVEPFTAATWTGLRGAAQPMAVVFTSTDCVHCPAVLERLAQRFRGMRPPAPLLVAVVVDAAPGEVDTELLARAHHRVADRLFAFAGPALALRFSVNPDWRGVTPYLALLQPGRAPQWITGPPSEADLEAWAGRR